MTDKPKRKLNDLKIATMLGAGMTQKQIAKELGVTQPAISMHAKKIAQDPALVEAREKARAELAPEAMRILKKNLGRIEEALDGQIATDKKGNVVLDGDGKPVKVMPPLNHMASSLRELASVSGIARDETPAPGAAGGGATIPLSAEAFVQMIEAVRKHQQTLLAPKTIEGERIE